MIGKKLLAIALLGLSLTAFATDEIRAIPQRLSEEEKQLAVWLDERQAQILDTLKSHVAINTGTENIKGLDSYRQLLGRELRQLGFATQEYPSEPVPILNCNGGEMTFANHLVATRRGGKPKRIFLSGHMDTVFGPTDTFQSLRVDRQGVLRGPGVADMKGGIVVMLYALKALHAHGRLDNANITVLLNSDEEIGSLGSRPLLERLARQHDVGLVFESSENNLLARARKGLGQARLKVTGRESHAGGAHEQGVSANLALAHKVVAIEELTDYRRGVTVNVGVMSGGEKRNTIPGCAEAYIDLRFPTLADGKYLQSAISRIAAAKEVSNAAFPELPKIELWMSLHRPAKEVDARVDKMIADAMGLSLLLGEPVQGGVYAGGGTDGSIMQAAGLPTVDSLGPDGSGIHSSREQITITSLMARTKLAAIILARQIDPGL